MIVKPATLKREIVQKLEQVHMQVIMQCNITLQSNLLDCVPVLLLNKSADRDHDLL